MANNTNSRQVNNLLHTLRGEHFRHLQNLRQSRSHLYPSRAFNSRTLPTGLLDSDYEQNEQIPTKPVEEDATTRRCSGPQPPKSWRLMSQEEDSHDSASWRFNALRLTTRKIPNLIDSSLVPPLTLLCLKILVTRCTDAEELLEIVPYILPHLRRDVIRSCVLQSPCPRWKLEILYHPEGHSDGEIIVAGPRTSLYDDEFLRNGLHSSKSHLPQSENKSEEEDDWEKEEPTERPLGTIIVLSTRMSASTMLTLPPTLINLVLIDLPTSLPLHRLPKVCPLLEFLDLSYNSWLRHPSVDVMKNVDRIDWRLWNQLKLLGWRECHIPDGLAERVNKGRWDDVEIVYS